MRRHLLGWGVLLFCTAAYVVALLAFLSSGTSAQALVTVVLLVAFFAYPVIGSLIVTQRPSNTVGWIFCAIGLGTAITSFSAGYVQQALAAHADAQLTTGLIDALGNAVWPLNIGLGSLLLLLFPDGRPLARRWRLIVWIDIVAIVALSLSSLLQPGPLETNGRVVNPLGLQAAGPVISAVDVMGTVLLLPLASLAIISVIVRYRRASGVQRQQIKWFAYGAALMALIIAGTNFVAVLLAPNGQNTANNTPSTIGFALGFVMLPLGAGIGVLRYRLYDIDVIINRTLVYGSLTALLAGVYFGSVIGMQQLARLLVGAQGAQNPLIIVLSTLLIAALFQPLRTRLQRAIDRRFYRAKYDAAKTIERFTATLRQQVEFDELSAHLEDAVRETMQPTSVSLWLRPPVPDRAEAAWQSAVPGRDQPS
jgi:hypothetical protein